jgi:hypothetical protein
VASGNTPRPSGQKRGQMSRFIIQLINKFRGKRELTTDEIMLGMLLMRVTNGDPTKKLIIEKTIGKREI